MLGTYQSYQGLPRLNPAPETFADFASGLAAGLNSIAPGEAVPTEMSLAESAEPANFCRYIVVRDAVANWDGNSIAQRGVSTGLFDIFSVLSDDFAKPKAIASMEAIAGYYLVAPISEQAVVAKGTDADAVETIGACRARGADAAYSLGGVRTEAAGTKGKYIAKGRKVAR